MSSDKGNHPHRLPCLGMQGDISPSPSPKSIVNMSVRPQMTNFKSHFLIANLRCREAKSTSRVAIHQRPAATSVERVQWSEPIRKQGASIGTPNQAQRPTQAGRPGRHHARHIKSNLPFWNVDRVHNYTNRILYGEGHRDVLHGWFKSDAVGDIQPGDIAYISYDWAHLGNQLHR